MTITENMENNGTEKIGLVTPTPGSQLLYSIYSDM